MRHYWVGLCLLVGLLPGVGSAQEARIPVGHRKTISALGLPVWRVTEQSRYTYHTALLSWSGPVTSYEIEYWMANGDRTAVAKIRCSNRPVSEPGGKILEVQKSSVRGVGGLEVLRYERQEGAFRTGGCRTRTVKVGDSYLQVLAGDIPLAQFVQLLEQLQVSPARPPERAARLQAMAATGIPAWQFQSGLGARLQSTRVELTAGRSWHNYVLEYSAPGSAHLNIRASRATRGENIGRKDPSDRVGVKVNGLPNVVAYLTEGKAQTHWIRSGQGFVRFESSGMSLDRFAAHLRQLRAVD